MNFNAPLHNPWSAHLTGQGNGGKKDIKKDLNCKKKIKITLKIEKLKTDKKNF